jgi:hypothetical protein
MSSSDVEFKTQSDEASIRIIKILINEIVKIKGESIIPIYKKSLENHCSVDKHLFRYKILTKIFINSL